jgi:hypothetical protein
VCKYVGDKRLACAGRASDEKQKEIRKLKISPIKGDVTLWPILMNFGILDDQLCQFWLCSILGFICWESKMAISCIYPVLYTPNINSAAHHPLLHALAWQLCHFVSLLASVI